MAIRSKCPRCHFRTTELVSIQEAGRGDGAFVCRHCLKILQEDRSARIECHALAKYTGPGFTRAQTIRGAVRVLGMVPLRKKPEIASHRCGGSFEEVIGDNIHYFFEIIHDNWRVLMKIHAGNESKHRELNHAMEVVKKWCSKRGLGRK